MCILLQAVGSVSLLLDTDKELLIVAFPGRGVSEDGGKTSLDNALEAFKDTLCARITCPKESFYGFVDTFTRLEYLVSLSLYHLDLMDSCKYLCFCINGNVALESKCPLPWYARFH